MRAFPSMNVLPLSGFVAMYLVQHQAHGFVTTTPKSLAPRTTAASSQLYVFQPEVVTGILSLGATTVDSASSSSRLMLAEYPVSPEPIHQAFQVGTFFSQPFFLLMILFPKSSITKKIMGGLEIPLAYALIHFFIVVASIATEGSGVTAPLSEFNNVFDPAGDSQQAFMGMVTRFPNFVAEEWIHVLCWDLFVGRYVWLDGLKRGIFTAPAVLFCNLIGPPGLLIHFVTCLLSGKPIVDPAVKEEIEALE